MRAGCRAEKDEEGMERKDGLGLHQGAERRMDGWLQLTGNWRERDEKRMRDGATASISHQSSNRIKLISNRLFSLCVYWEYRE